MVLLFVKAICALAGIVLFCASILIAIAIFGFACYIGIVFTVCKALASALKQRRGLS